MTSTTDSTIVARNLYRILDASVNRGREALRVLEDACRFLSDDADLTAQLKETRHEFAMVSERLDREQRMLARDTTHDVGVSISTADEYQRGSLTKIVVANFARLQESLRSLEEFCKLLAPELAPKWEALRYRSYTLEKELYAMAKNLKLD
ncbi:MAG: hypothetical protein Q4G03_09650 [Planctomycetia bacterium]|nr:hypothetical protein [Planctomycetia bacterium]